MKRLILSLLLTMGSLAHAQNLEALIGKVREVQNKVETAYVATKAMGPEATHMVLSATNDAMALFREVALLETEGSLTVAQKERIYEELLRGQRSDDDQVDTKGSLVRLFWMTMTHHGYDPKMTFDGKVTPYGTFLKTFVEVFGDVRSFFTLRRDADGKFKLSSWGPLERTQRERATRNMIVRLFDINETLNKTEKNDDLYKYVSDQLYTTAETGADLRIERLGAEKLAIAFYASMMGLNLIAPQPLPLINFDFVGLLTNNIWGSSLISGAAFFASYAAFLSYKYISQTSKSHRMMLDLLRVVADPVETARALKKGGELNESEKGAALKDYREFVESIRQGKGALGRHRQKMIERGYDPLNPLPLSCEAALKQAFL